MSKVAKVLVGAAAIGFAAFTGGVSLAGLGSFLTTGITGRLLTSVALSALSQALVKPQGQKNPGIRSSSTARGDINPDGFILGRYATAGAAVAPPYTHSRSGHKTPNPYLQYVIHLGGAPGQKLAGIMIDGRMCRIGDEHGEIPWDGNTNFGGSNDWYGKLREYGAAIFIDGTEGAWSWVRYSDGTQQDPDGRLINRYGDHPTRPWTADMVGTGICHAVVTFQLNQSVFSGFPQVQFVMEGMPLYDPRKDSTVGGNGGHRWGQPSTYTSTENPAVQIYNLLRGITLPGGRVYGGRARAEQLPTSSWFAGMNACDASVALAGGGSEKAWRTSYEISVADEPAAVIEELCSAASIQLTEMGGTWKIRVGAPGVPVAWLTDDDIIISQEQTHEQFPGLDQTYNGASISFPDPASGWQAVEAPIYVRADYAAQDQGRELIANLSLPAAPYQAQNQRLARAYVEEERRFRRHVVTLPPDYGALEPLDALAWSSERNGYEDKIFEVVQTTTDPVTQLVTASLRERDPGDYDWEPGFELPYAPKPPIWTGPVVVEVGDFAVSGLIITDANGVARRPAILLTWDTDDLEDVDGLEWEVRLSGATDPLLRGSITDVTSGRLVIAEGILPNEAYQVRARMVGKAFDNIWSVWLAVVTPDVRLGWGDFDDNVYIDVEAVVDAAQEAEAAANDARIKRDEALAYRDDSKVQRDAAAVSRQAADKARDEAATKATAADGSARASAGSATVAATKADDAGKSAQAAAAERLAAGTARTGAESARDGSVAAREGAEAAAATATQQAGVVASITGATGGVLKDQYLGTGTAWGAYMTGPDWLTNAIYPVGRTARFNLNATTEGGLALRSNWANSGWTGPTHAEAYVVEVEFTLASGSIVGSGILFDWQNTNGDYFRVAKPMSDMLRGPRRTGQVMVASAVFKRPANYSGTFSHNTIHVMANYNGFGLAAGDIRFHRVTVRVATAEELGGGEVGASMQAYVTQRFNAFVDDEFGALAEDVTEIGASVGGLSATVQQQSTAIAGINGDMSAMLAFRVKAGSAGALFELVAGDDANGGPASTSVARIEATQILLRGTVGMDMLAVGLGRNWLQNSTLAAKLANWSKYGPGGSQVNAQTVLDLRPASTSGNYAGSTYPTLMLYQNGTANDSWSAVTNLPTMQAEGGASFGYPCAPGQWVEGSVGASIHRCNAHVILNFYDGAGSLISFHTLQSSGHNTSSATNPEVWPRLGGRRQAPAGAAFARLEVRKEGTQSGTNSYVFMHRPQLCESHAEATSLAPWAPDGTTVVAGGQIMTDAIEARHIKAKQVNADAMAANSITAANGAIADLSVDTLQIRGNAVSISAFADAPDNVFFVGRTTLASVSINRSGGFSTAISLAFAYRSPADTNIGVFLYRGSTLIRTWYASNQSKTFLDAGMFSVSTVDDNTGSGATSYSLQVQRVGASVVSQAEASLAFISATQFKR